MSEIKIIESDEKKMPNTLRDCFPTPWFIWGDGTDPKLLTAENIAGMDAFVALTGRDEDNILLSLLAKQLGAGKAHRQSQPLELSVFGPGNRR